jgi:hypothetical protein
MTISDWVLAVVIIVLWNGYLLRKMNKEKQKTQDEYKK